MQERSIPSESDFLLQEMGGQTYLPDRTSSFKQGWIKSDYTPIDKLKDNNAAIAYGLYRKEYDKIVAEAVKRGYSPTSIRTSRELVQARAYLRRFATKLISDYPEFGPLYNSILENESCEVKESLEEVSNPLTTIQTGNETRSRGNALCEGDEGVRAQDRDEEQGNYDDNGGDGGEEGEEVAVLEMRALDSQRAMGATIDGICVVLDADGAEGYNAEEYISESALHPSSHGDAKQQEFDLLASPAEKSKEGP